MKRLLGLIAAALFFLAPAFAQVGLPWPGPGTVHSAGGGGWTPTSEGANLKGWWKATVVTPTSGTVTTWQDSSGNSNALAPSAGNLTSNATSFNTSFAGVTMDRGVAQALLASSNIAINSANFSYFTSVAPWCSTHSTQVNGRIVSVLAAGQTNDYDNANSFEVDVGSTCTLTLYANNTSIASTAITDGTPIEVGVTFNGTQACLYLNNALVGSCGSFTTNIGNGTGIAIRQFAEHNGGADNEYMSGIYCDSIISTSVVTAANYHTYALTQCGI